MISLPDLGVGVIFAPGLEPYIEAGCDCIDVIEVEPQTSWVPGSSRSKSSLQSSSQSGGHLDPKSLAWLNEQRQIKLAHGVANPFGGTVAPSAADIAAFAKAVEALDAPWCSEHLSFNRIEHNNEIKNAGFLLPPLQTLEHADRIIRNIQDFKKHLTVPLAFETGVNYLQPRDGELSDGEFWAYIAEQADCGILLDFHNLWCNQQNGRTSVEQVMRSLPLKRVWEIHVAGGESHKGYTLDAHSNLTDLAVMQLLTQYLPQLPNVHALILEIIPQWLNKNSISPTQFCDHVHDLKALWQTRGSSSFHTTQAPMQRLSVSQDKPTTASEYERSVAGLVNGISLASPLDPTLKDDKGIEILNDLVAAVRCGSIVERLPLTCRLVAYSDARDQTRDHTSNRLEKLIQEFRAQQFPARYEYEEAIAFTEFLLKEIPNLNGLSDVIHYELACQAAQLNEKPIKVTLEHNPANLLLPLVNGMAPDNLVSPSNGPFVLNINPMG